VQLVTRHLVETRLRREGRWVSPETVEQRVEKLKIDLLAEKRSLGDLLQKRGLSLQSLKEQIAWEESWKAYVGSTLSEEYLRAHYEEHRDQFDGTQRRVRHILLRPTTSAESNTVGELIQQAQSLQQKIVRGQVSFTDAARSHSAGPSRRRGGDLGFVGRHGPMAEAFSTVAFQLQPGQLSEPVVTRFGVHLIEVTEIRPGSRSWEQVQSQVRTSAEKALLARLSRQEAQTTRVTFGSTVAPNTP
jgi:parvulin-like peptidyl-prolyl isomerase